VTRRATGTAAGPRYDGRVDPLILARFALGLVALVGGAELLVRGASHLATAMGIRPLVVGLTVVAFGTSAPELAVGVSSALAGQPDIALGNVVGSNIANVLLVLGLASLAVPVIAGVRVVRREVPLMIAASLALWLMALSGQVDRLEGAILFTGIVAYTAFLGRSSHRESARVRAEFAAEFGAGAGHGVREIAADLALAGAGLVLLLVGADWIVAGATSMATSLGIPEIVVGLTIVAIGTSLPEIATSVMAGLRGHRDIAVGNVVGSCIFNILMVLGVTAVVAPQPLSVSPDLLAVDLPLMVAAAVACLPILYTGSVVDRREGALLLAFYVAYLGYLGLVAFDPPAAGTYGSVLVLGAVPVAGVVLAWRAVRAWSKPRNGRPAYPAGG
jgi:cation:H+ antiporter